MKAIVFFFVLLSSVQALADLVLIPRYDYIRGEKEELSNRLVLKGKLNANAGAFGVYTEGFGETEFNDDQALNRRSPQRGYLQEAYLEFKKDSIYLRLGKQALRWSEMWTLPSLDIWTGRRWNRLFFDPLADQLTYPTGLSFSYAADSFSIDLVGVWQVAETTYPVPFSEVNTEGQTGYGGRIKWAWDNFGFSGLAAKIADKNHLGLTSNYAFENVVPKMEYGWVQDTEAAATIPRESIFTTLGADIFWGNWILMPQLTAFEINKLSNKTEIQNNIYLSAQWNPQRHDFQMVFFENIQTKAQYANLSYGYNFTDSFSLTGFYQNYYGPGGDLYGTYQEITGGSVFGVRAEFSGNLIF